jgi:hypothetical protein
MRSIGRVEKSATGKALGHENRRTKDTKEKSA